MSFRSILQKKTQHVEIFARCMAETESGSTFICVKLHAANLRCLVNLHSARQFLPVLLLWLLLFFVSPLLTVIKHLSS